MKNMHASIPRSNKKKQAALVAAASAGGHMRKSRRGVAQGASAKSLRPEGTLLADVVEDYLADAKKRLSPRTWQPYVSHLRVLVSLIGQHVSGEARLAKRKARAATLGDLTAANVRAVIADLEVYNARGKAIAARALGTYLAETGNWYVGHDALPLSVLCKLEIPKAPAKGRPIYTDDDLMVVREAANAHRRRPYMQGALQLLGELGLRPGVEMASLRLADVHLPRFTRDRGYLEIQEEDGKTERGARQVPLEPNAVLALDAYLRLERPAFEGKDAENEPFFLTEDGLPFTYAGWNSMRQRFRRHVAQFESSLKYKASRNRGTRTAKLRENGYEDSEIMQMQGWSTHGMIRRYAGDISRKNLERKPVTTALRRSELRRVG